MTAFNRGRFGAEPESYQSAARLLGSEPDEVMMIAVHPGDLLAAKRAGLKTGYVKPKVWEPGADGPTEGFDVAVEDYGELARILCTAQ